MTHIEEVVKAETGREQPELGLATQGIEQVDTGPVLFLGDIEVIDQLEQVADQAMDDLLGAVIATGFIKAGHGFDEVLNLGRVEYFYSHGETLCLLWGVVVVIRFGVLCGELAVVITH